MNDLHARIAAAVAETRAEWESYDTDTPGRDIILAACDHADKVLARHNGLHRCIGGYLYGWSQPYCSEVRDLADLWLGEGWDQ